MEELNQCPLCGKELKNNNINPKNLVALCAEDFLITGNSFKIEKCPNCKFLFTNPRPDQKEIKKYYHSEAYTSHTEKKRSSRDRLYFQAQKIMLGRKIALLKKHTKPHQRLLLDYGCGTGNFLYHTQVSGFLSVGYEPEKKARDIALGKGLSVYDQPGALIKKNTQKYDIICMWHVLEHIHEFPKILNDIYTILQTNGKLFIAVPMAKSTDAAYYKENWAGWDLPRHLYHFTRESLEIACHHTDFQLIERKGMPFDSYYVSWLSEQNKKARLAPLNAFIIGSWSNMKAVLGKAPWSSEIFVFRKRG